MTRFKVYFSVAGLIFILLMTGCSNPSNNVSTTEDTTYLTPIPEATIVAYKAGPSIENKLQAVIAARRELDTPPHFKPIGTQMVLFVKELRLADAYKLIKNSIIHYNSPDWTEDTRVWVVVFKGDIQATSPGQHTPQPPFHSCSYVIIRAEGDRGYGDVGGFVCSEAAGLK